jgi:hypothetical protein
LCVFFFFFFLRSDAIKRTLRFWAGTGLVRHCGGDEWALELDDSNVLDAAPAEQMDDSGEEDEGDDLETAEPFVLHMLNNLGGLSVNQIQDQLKSFADLDISVAVLRDHLNAMVTDSKIGIKNNVYVPFVQK